MGLPAEQKPTLVLGVRYAERKNDPPPGLVWRKAGTSPAHPEGETLGSIADEYGVRWIDLALYNWHTVNPLEINWYLHHFLGCTKNNGKTYSFTGHEKLQSGLNREGGWLLVPNTPPSVKKGPSRSVAAVRNGSATHDIKLQVYVVEWLASGAQTPTTGKWLYVFSGRGGVDFGYDPPPPPARTDAPPLAQPGSAFTLDFPGVFPIKERPDTLEYEILITPQDAASPSLVALSGLKDDQGTPYYKPGTKWYFLSGHILDNALTQPRDARPPHAFRNTTWVTIDLKDNRRFYFLLSPAQLGSEALKFAMANPKGLTPLLKPGDNTAQWDPSNPSGPPLNRFVGPTIDDIKSGAITLPVIDPYHWAETIAEVTYQDALGQYVKWLGINATSSGKNETTKQLTQETGWSLDQLYIAKTLKAVRDSHPSPGSIDAELKNFNKWRDDLYEWNTRLTQRDAEINANAHRSLLQLTEWLQGPGHTIVETAILKDTTADSPEDAIDIAHGILHWYVCAEPIIALEPGVAFLRDLFSHPGKLPTDIVLKNLNLDGSLVKISDTHKVAFRYAAEGALMLLALKDFVSAAPQVVSDGTREDYLMKLADYLAVRRDRLIKLLNDSKILPAKVQAPVIPPFQSPLKKGQVAAALLNSALDAADKLATWTMSEHIRIPRKYGLTPLAMLEGWCKGRTRFARYTKTGMAWSLKLVAFPINALNLYTLVTGARYDYQQNRMTVSKVDYVQAVSGTTLALQDLLSEVATFYEHRGLHKILPQLITTQGGPAWGIAPIRTMGIAGGVFAGINVLAMIVSGITTVISMEKSRKKALNQGDYTAARYYLVGAAGGGLMTAGGVCFGLALFFTSSGVLATVGILLFFAGGILSLIGSLGGSANTSDDYQVFARKCFLGTQGDEEPRFGSEPKDWSNALTEGTNTWPIELQKKALHNLLGTYSLKTNLTVTLDKVWGEGLFAGGVECTIKPGLFLAGSTIEIALHYDRKGASKTAATMVWDSSEPPQHDFRLVHASKNGLFDPDSTSVLYKERNDAFEEITVTAQNVNYNSKFGDLLATVTVRFPDLPNRIRTRKRVISSSPGWIDGIDDNTEVSAIFDERE